VKARELNTAMSRIETLRSLEVAPEVVPAHHKQDSVNATRRMLDRTWIDSNPCERGLDAFEELQGMRYEWKDRQRIWTAYPLHDWASHACDALVTFVTGYEDPSITPGQKRRVAARLPRTGRHEQGMVLMPTL
jgi:hypothetical protein